MTYDHSVFDHLQELDVLTLRELQNTVTQRLQDAKAETLAMVKSLMDAAELKTSDLVAPRAVPPTKPRKAKKRPTPPRRYQLGTVFVHPDDPSVTWTAKRGKPPAWVASVAATPVDDNPL